MSTNAFHTVALFCFGCVMLATGLWMASSIIEHRDARVENTTASPTAPLASQPQASVIVKEETAVKPSAVVVAEKSAELRLWKRINGTCYLSITAKPWESIYVDVTGPVCDSATGSNAVVLR